jgi:hypothetical protein
MKFHLTVHNFIAFVSSGISHNVMKGQTLFVAIKYIKGLCQIGKSSGKVPKFELGMRTTKITFTRQSTILSQAFGIGRREGTSFDTSSNVCPGESCEHLRSVCKSINNRVVIQCFAHLRMAAQKLIPLHNNNLAVLIREHEVKITLRHS